jgi:enamine deaminase RidA (YjgF/YER057c/UK114 family)
MNVQSRIDALGIKLLKNATPIGNFTYVPCRRSGNLIYVSGQLPRIERDGALQLMEGKVGLTVDTNQAREAAKMCAISILSVLSDAIGSLDRVKAVVKVEGFVNATESFTDHPIVLNGCSDIFVEVFGAEIGSHARAAVGCSSLPKGVPVEVSAIFEIQD